MLKRVLITGGCGFVGFHVIRLLLNNNTTEAILCLDNYLTGSKNNQVKDDARVRYVEDSTLNIAKYADFRPTCVFHFGEYSRINSSFEEPLLVFESNQLGTSRVLDFCVKLKCKLVYSASSAIFGRENHSSPYTLTKAHNVELIEKYGEWFDLDHVIVYFHNVYGSGQIEEGKYATVVGIFAKCAAEAKAIPVVRPGSQRRTFTHIEDTVRGIILAATKGQGDGYIIRSDASEDEISILELARKFDTHIKFLPPRRGDRSGVLKVKPSSGKMKALGWQPVHHLQAYIDQVHRLQGDQLRLENSQTTFSVDDLVTGERIAKLCTPVESAVRPDQDVLYCCSSKLRNLESLIQTLKSVEHKFTLVLHNSDSSFDEKYTRLFDEVPLLRRIFTQNMNVIHPSVSPLPIGIANSTWKFGDLGRLENHIRRAATSTHKPGVFQFYH